MSFTSAIRRVPIAFDPDAGAEAADRFAGLAPEVREVLAGAAGCSPYLRGLMLREAAWLEEAFGQPPAEVLPGLTPPLLSLPVSGLGPALRQAKGRVALFAGLADLAGVWALHEVTAALTDFADLSTDLVLKALVGAEINRGKLPGLTEDDIPTAGGMVALAMGKMGAGELNYSSDIDLICLFDETRLDPADFQEVRAGFIRVTRRLSKLLSEKTGDGYVWRTDLRLRPDPSVTPVCLSMEAAERYYESVGRTWERAAHIKARPAAGDLAAGAAYLERLGPFIWRRHLDFAAIQDAHDMRLKIRDHKGLHETGALEGRDLKLAPGGIREIEFFTQTRQIIAGGRDPSLRVRGTVDGLARLAAAGWIPDTLSDELAAHYAKLREWEHRVQMVSDARTHALPTSDEGFDRMARMCGEGDTKAFRTEIRQTLQDVTGAAEQFFVPALEAHPAQKAADEPEIVSRWRHYPALRSDRAFAIFERLKPDLLARLSAADRPEEALAAFDGFLSGLPAGVQLFSMFEANPQLRALIVDIAATAPALARYLSRNAGVLDAVIGGDFFAEWPGKAALVADLTRALTAADDYEARLDTARRWAKEWHFRVGVHHLRGLTDAAEAGRQYAGLAEAVIAALLPVVVDSFAAKHGAPPGQGAMVLGMGSLGAGWLNARSDLDLIVIYAAPGDAESDGPRPLATRPYYARLTQALLTAVTAPTAEGKLYEVDMRLRPSGKQGPVATSLASFDNYQRNEAWTWEHLALTRARAVAGPPDLCAAVEAVRAGVLSGPKDAAKIRSDVAEMRTRLSEAKPQSGPMDVKNGAGGLLDIEIVAQAGALLAGSSLRRTPAQLAAAGRAEVFPQEAAEELAAAYRLARAVQSAARLLHEGPLDADGLGQGARDMLARATGLADPDDIMSVLAAHRGRAAEIIDRWLADSAAG